LLAAQGYEIVAPEALSIAEQVKFYQTTDRLIFAESSAVHLFALVRRPGQISAVIQRHEAAPPIILAQMQNRIGQPSIAINAIKETYWPPMRGDHLALSVLDFDRLGEELEAQDLIRLTSWFAPSKETVAQSLNAALAPGHRFIREWERMNWLRQMRVKLRQPRAA